MASDLYASCGYCGGREQQPHSFTCSRCLDVKYCTKEHQSLHWKEAHCEECRGRGGKAPTLAEQVASLRLAMQAHAEKTRRVSEEILKAGAERERIWKEVSAAGDAVRRIAEEKQRAEREVLKAQSDLKAKSKEIEMCLTMMGGQYAAGYEESPEWGPPPALTAAQLSFIVQKLSRQGWAFIDDFIDSAAVNKMRTYWLERYTSGMPIHRDGNFDRGRMGGGRSGSNLKYVNEESRGDFVRWLSPQDEDCPMSYKWLRAGMDRLVCDVAERCQDILKNAKTVVAQSSMVAIYPKSSGCGIESRYIRHIDNPIDDGRILTVMVYLNPPEWSPSVHGGALRVFEAAAAADGSESSTDISPAGGRLVVFLSDRVPHEVLPVTASVDRMAITTWYMDFSARARATCEEPSQRERAKLEQEVERMNGRVVDGEAHATA
ncbi:Egl nine 1 [Perkinsus chesapeaki]|uniref:Egl nine 1 n=1 Tax=Perkinsus chesapeaki TaxID=330153 RepID=A0A7J6MNL3_PERCH|nr:Egl nine 1 [Perkinsus chesapeaki]